jgi:hypothetical protein
MYAGESSRKKHLIIQRKERQFRGESSFALRHAVSTSKPFRGMRVGHGLSQYSAPTVTIESSHRATRSRCVSRAKLSHEPGHHATQLALRTCHVTEGKFLSSISCSTGRKLQPASSNICRLCSLVRASIPEYAPCQATTERNRPLPSLYLKTSAATEAPVQSTFCQRLCASASAFLLRSRVSASVTLQSQKPAATVLSRLGCKS